MPHATKPGQALDRTSEARDVSTPHAETGPSLGALGDPGDAADARLRLNSIIEASQIGTWEWNLQSGALRVNDRWAQMLGYTLADLNPISIESCSALRHPDDRAAAIKRAEMHFVGVEPYYEFEARMRHKDGHWVWVLDRGQVVSRDPDGKPILMVGTHQDISQRKAVEAQIEGLSHSLKLALDISGLGVWEHDVDTGVITIDEGMRTIYGVPEPVDRITHQDAAALIHPDDRVQVAVEIERARQTRDAFESRFRAVRPDGSVRHIQSSVRVSSGPGEPFRMMGVDRDITADVEKTRELEAKRAEAEAAAVAKSQFLATMSHEIRTPMNGVIGMLEVLRRYELDAEQKQHAEVALTSAQQLLHVLNNVLDVSKLESGQVTMEERPFSVAALVEAAASLFAVKATQAGLALTVRIEPDVPAWARGDAARMRQILNNFVDNAVKFTAAGQVEISVARDPGTERLIFAVTDTGVGIAEPSRARLFQPFVQADASTTRRYGGTGLGLAICRQLATLMGGEVGVESDVGRGSRFWFAVPAAASADPGQGPVHAVPSAEPRALRVLVAEDNETNRRVIAALLGTFGHRFTIVEDGVEAVAAARTGEFDVVLMDVQMPVMDGPAATRAIRALGGRFETLPIIALTANALPGHRAEYMAAGMTDYVSKPIEVPALFAALERVG